MDKETISSIKLDKSKDFGVVIPPHKGAHYEQNGLHFDNEGNLVEEMLTDDDVKRLDRLERQRKADKVAAEARTKFLASEGLTEDDLKADPVGTVTKLVAQNPDNESDVDLIAWARGQAKYKFFVVRAAFEKQFHYTPNDGKAAVNWLVENDKLTEEEVGVRF